MKIELTGKFVDLRQDFLTGDTFITFKVNEPNLAKLQVEKIKDLDKLRIKVVKYRERRSLDANAYFWKMLSELAGVLNTTKDDLYLEILDRYGVFTHIIAKPNVVEKVKTEWRTVRELGEVSVNGITGIQLQCYFGSSTYDTKEMSRLIDGLVKECKKLGINTATPQEIEHMKAVWGK